MSNSESVALELKGGLLPLMVLRLLSSDNHEIAEQLARKVSQAPGFFRNAPVVIDLQVLSTEENSIHLALLVKLVRTYGLIPIGIRGGNAQQNEVAAALNLAVFLDTKSEKNRPDEPSALLEMAKAKIITHPVRSGQQVVALHGDLIVLSMVSPGAEILALRHIHVYGILRGRALAGVHGDTHARIFCQHFDAELVSIAGHYQVNEELPEHLLGKPAQVYLEQDVLKIEALENYVR